MQPLTSATSAGVTLSLGMLNLTVSVHGAVGEDDSASLRTVCVHDHAPTAIKQKYVCPVCSDEDRTRFVKARQVGDGFVVITDEILAQVKDAGAAFKKQIHLTVHPASEVSSVLMPSGKSYYLSMKTPNPATTETYTLLGKLVLSRPDLAFMTKFTLRSATSLFQLTVAGEGTLVLRQMADAELVREHPVIAFTPIEDRMLELAGMLADQQAQPFTVAAHGTGANTIIAQFAASQVPVAAEATGVVPTAGGNVLDMTAALEAMVKAGTPRAPRKPRASRAKPVVAAVAELVS